MAELSNSPANSDEARRSKEAYHNQAPAQPETHGMKRELPEASLSQDIRAHTNHPHKGDVGRPGTNEDIYQGSKTRELP